MMPPEQQQQLKAHADAIAAILLADAKAKHPDRLDTLEGIELTVRQQIQAHVSPHVGVFLSSRAAVPPLANPAP